MTYMQEINEEYAAPSSILPFLSFITLRSAQHDAAIFFLITCHRKAYPWSAVKPASEAICNCKFDYEYLEEKEHPS